MHRNGSIPFTHVGHSVVNITIVVPQRREYYHRSFGQVNVDRSCRVIWSIVGVVCLLFLPVSIKRDRLRILTVCLLIPSSCLDVLRCQARDILFSIALREEELDVLMRLSIGL